MVISQHIHIYQKPPISLFYKRSFGTSIVILRFHSRNHETKNFPEGFHGRHWLFWAKPAVHSIDPISPDAVPAPLMPACSGCGVRRVLEDEWIPWKVWDLTNKNRILMRTSWKYLSDRIRFGWVQKVGDTPEMFAQKGCLIFDQWRTTG